MSTRACAVVLGVGAAQGIGAAVCRRLARAGLYVHVVGRTSSKIDDVVQAIQREGGQAQSHCLDATNASDIDGLFHKINQAGDQLHVVVNNVGSNMPSRFLSTEPQFFDAMWRATFLSGFLVSQAVLPQMKQQGHGTLLFTGASGSLRGKPFFAAFSSGKSALRAYSQALAAEFAPYGVHVAHVVVDGMVDGDRINQFGFGVGRLVKRVLKGANGALDVNAIADNYWHIHQQPQSLWTQEIDLRPFKESF